jgi:sulfhydrogenase subunit beta (sulfur reductase)
MSISNAEKKLWLISQSELEAWLDGISTARNLVAPRRLSGIILYRPVTNSDQIAWLDRTPESAYTDRPIMSIKEIFFPPTELLFRIHKTGQDIHLEESFPEWETIAFGVRPCDARGVKLLDALFLDTNPVDSFYARRRGNTTLIGIACKAAGSTCFCTSVGGGPDDNHDVDIMLYPTDIGYLVEAVTEKGRFLVPGGEWKESKTNPEHSPSPKEYSLPGKRKWLEKYNDEYWTKVSERCLSCRVCAYVCPTCRCFVTRDEIVKRGEFERIRCWDSCSGENYRRVAGGHQPRSDKSERLRNRFFCKFVYYSQQYGLGAASACTGCGRCIEVCPTGVDITEVLINLEKPA